MQRQAFRTLDRDTRAFLPDSHVSNRNEFVRTARVDTGVPSGTRIHTTDELARYAQQSRLLSRNVERTLRRANRTRLLKYLGGSIAITAITAGSLYSLAVVLSQKNTGCFMYRNVNGEITKCKVSGCSCPISYVEKPCDESLFNCDQFTVSGNKCANADNRQCVHCDWNIEDTDSVHYVDRACLPDDAYLQCENQDAMDALWELIGGTLDSSWNRANDFLGGASDSLGSVMKFVPYIFGFIGILFAIIASVWIFRAMRSTSSVQNTHGYAINTIPQTI